MKLVDVGEPPEREGLLDTPKRAAKAMQYRLQHSRLVAQTKIRSRERKRKDDDGADEPF